MGKSESKYNNTAKKMNSAMIRLLESEDFEQITVTEVCNEAEVNRSTFYSHYTNTRELLAETRINLLGEFLSNFEHLSENENFLSRDYLYTYLTFLERNGTIFKIMLTNSELFEPDSIFNDFKDIFAKGVFLKDEIRPAFVDYKLRFIASGITSIVSTWLTGGCKESKEFIIEVISECIGVKR